MKKLPVPVDYRIVGCEFKHNFGCWGGLYRARFKIEETGQLSTHVGCFALKNNLKQSKHNWGKLDSEWKEEISVPNTPSVEVSK